MGSDLNTGITTETDAIHRSPYCRAAVYIEDPNGYTVELYKD